MSSSSSTASSALELEARQLSLPKPLLHTQSFLYDSNSNSLALRHSDSSFSLYPSFSPLASPSFPSPQSLIPSPISSAAFLHLRTSTSPVTTLFLTSSPLLRPSSSTLLKFHILRDNRFSRIRHVSSNHTDLDFDSFKGGVIFKVDHGVSMRLCGGVNFFTLYSVSTCKIWVFGVRLIGDGGEALKLIKCAVIDCCFRIFEIKCLFGFLILGEVNGVRVYPIRGLVKGKYRKEKKKNGGGKKLLDLQNGGKANGDLNLSFVKGDKPSDSAKLRTLNLRQDSKDVGAIFVAFKNEESSMSLKAVSVHALSANKFVILDSVGDIHLLSLSYSVNGLFVPHPMQQLPHTMKVEKLAVFHDISKVTQIVWISDGSNTVHQIVVSDLDASSEETGKKETGDKILQASVKKAIFTSEKIQDMVPFAAESVLILGQGSMFAYAIS